MYRVLEIHDAEYIGHSAAHPILMTHKPSIFLACHEQGILLLASNATPCLRVYSIVCRLLLQLSFWALMLF